MSVESDEDFAALLQVRKLRLMRGSNLGTLVAVTFLAGLSIVSLGAASHAEVGPGDALRSFDLIGTWSRNCAVPLESLGSSRITYEVRENGHASFTTTATVMLVDHTQYSQVGSHFEIDSATLLSDKQIKLVGKITINCPGCRNPTPSDTSPRQIIVERVGAQIHIIDNRRLDGTGIAVDAGIVRGTGQPTPLNNKCANMG